MTRNVKIYGFVAILFFGIVILFFSYCPERQKLWQNIMLWVNFGILVFLFLKFAKKPLMDFLLGESKKIEEDLQAVDSQFKDAKALMDVESDKFKDIDQRIEEIKKSIHNMGTLEKERIIKQAKTTAEKMILDAEAYSKHRILAAKKALADEMVDVAISMVKDKLTKEISKGDNEKLFSRFLENLGSSEHHFK